MIGFGGRSIDELSISYGVDRTTGAAGVHRARAAPARPQRLRFVVFLWYSSGSGTSPFGAGWALTALPAIGIDTRDHVPRWDGTDGYQLSGDGLFWQPGN